MLYAQKKIKEVVLGKQERRLETKSTHPAKIFETTSV